MIVRVGISVLLLLVGVLALAAWQGRRRWNAETADLLRRLEAGERGNPVSRYAEAELAGLPPPVARYLRLVLRDGQPAVRRARVAWTGSFNMGKPGAESWKPFAATQTYVVDAPGFVWDARIAMAPGLPVFVCDGFVAGSGSMRGRIAGLVPVVNRGGTKELAAAALQRHLAEALWFPTALLPSQGVSWEPIDDRRAKATLRSGGVTASVEFPFGADGLVEEAFVAARLFDDGKGAPVPYPWRARILSWREAGGFKVPAEAVAEWLLPNGAYAYWRGGPVSVAYEPALE